MSHLLDVNLLLACAWSGHADHARANRWLNSVPEFFTAPVTQMGFLRVSMSVAYGASFADAQTVLRAILQLKSHRFLNDTVSADSLPTLTHGKDVTDAHLTSEVIRQAFFQDFFAGFFQGLLPRSTRSNRATTGLPAFRNAAS